MRKQDKITYRDQTRLVVEWAMSQTAIPTLTFLRRLNKGWTIGQLLGDEPPPPPTKTSKTPRGRNGRLPTVIEYNGLKLTLEEWATRAGIPKQTFINRRKQSNNPWTMPQLLGEEPRPGGKGRRPAGAAESVPQKVAKTTPEDLALLRVQKNREVARRELVAAGSAPIRDAIERRVRALVREEERLQASIASASSKRRPL